MLRLCHMNNIILGFRFEYCKMSTYNMFRYNKSYNKHYPNTVQKYFNLKPEWKYVRTYIYNEHGMLLLFLVSIGLHRNYFMVCFKSV